MHTAIIWLNMVFNPFKPNGISNHYQLEQYISVQGMLGGIFHFYSSFNRIFCKQTVETLIRRHILRCLIWACTICLRPTKKVLARLIHFVWVNDY